MAAEFTVKPNASVVIVTLGRVDEVLSALKALRYQTFLNFEVILVVGHSPVSFRLIENLSNYEDVRVIKVSFANIAAARNVGLQHSRSDIVAFLDDDAIPEPRWLENLSIALSKGAAMVGGSVRDKDGYGWQYRGAFVDDYGNAQHSNLNVESNSGIKLIHDKTFSPLGANFAVNRASALEVGGFCEVYSYLLEESELARRLVNAGYSLAYAQEAEVIHMQSRGTFRYGDGFPESYLGIWRSKCFWLYKNLISKYEFAEICRYIYSLEKTMKANISRSLKAELIDLPRADSLNASIDIGHREALSYVFSHARNNNVQFELISDPEACFKTFIGFPRIVIACSSFDILDSGIGVWTRDLARELALIGHVVTVIASSDDSDCVEFSEHSYWIHRVRPVSNSKSSLPSYISDRTKAVKLAHLDISKRRGCDIFQGPIWDVEGLDVSSKVMVTSLHTSYGLTQNDHPEWFINGKPQQFLKLVMQQEVKLLNSSTMLLANSRAIVEDIQKEYNVKLNTRIQIIPHAIEPLKEELLRFSNPKMSNQLVFIGRAEHRKGVDVFLRIVERLKGSGVTLNQKPIIIGGSSPFFEESLANTQLVLGEDIDYLGRISNEEKDLVLRQKPILIIPSRYESFGLIALEGMKYGCIVIANNVGGLKEIITSGETGFLIENNRTEDYLDAITRVMSDKSLSSKVSNNAQHTAWNQYAPRKLYGELSNIYKTIWEGN